MQYVAGLLHFRPSWYQGDVGGCWVVFHLLIAVELLQNSVWFLGQILDCLEKKHHIFPQQETWFEESVNWLMLNMSNSKVLLKG